MAARTPQYLIHEVESWAGQQDVSRSD